MKFDVIVGNPPYQKINGAATNPPIWHKFVDLAFEKCVNNGYVALLHPSGWRTGKTRFRKVYDRVINSNILLLQTSNYQTGLDIFGVCTTCDWYVVRNSVRESNEIRVRDINNNTVILDIENAKQIPDNLSAEYLNCLDLTLTNNIRVVYDASAYHHQKLHVVADKSEEYCYPVVYTLNKQGPSLKYSNTISYGHYGVSKIILGRGAGNPVLDLEGKYATCEFSFYIVGENNEYLEKVYDALCSKTTLDLLHNIACGGSAKYVMDAVRLLKYDFYNLLPIK